jgi:hypothetical protein
VTGVPRTSLIRRSGWALFMVGLMGLALGLPVATWLHQDNSDVFNRYVGWANVLAASLGAIGLGLVIMDRLHAERDLSSAKLGEIADQLSVQVLRAEGWQLARLLGTDELDYRAASVTLERIRPAGVKKRAMRPAKKDLVSLESVADYFLNETCGKLVVTGGPGTGKTVAGLKVLTDIAARRKMGEFFTSAGRGEPVPVIFSLPGWPQDEDLAKWLSAELASRFALRPQVATSLAEQGYILPILESLDEVDGEGGSGGRAAKLIEGINRYVATTVGALVLITLRNDSQKCRILRKKLRGFDELSIRPLSLEDIVEYVNAQCEDAEVEAWKAILDEATVRTSPVYAVLSVPWRLAMAITYVKSGEDPSQLLPTESEMRAPSKQSVNGPYISRVEHLLYGTFVHVKSRHYGQDPISVLRRLRRMAHLLASAERDPGESAPDIVLHEWWRVVAKERKVHRKQLWFSWWALHIPFAFWGLIEIWLPTGRLSGGWLALLGFGANYILLYMLTFQTVAGNTLPRVITARGLLTYRGMLFTALTVALAVSFGLLAYNVVGPNYGIMVGIGGTALCVITLARTAHDPAVTQSPTAILRKDMLANFVFGVAYGVMQVAILMDLVGLAMSICFGMAYVVGSVVSSVMARYLIAVYVGWRTFGLPLRFASFLTWATQAGLLRTSGVGYQFRHEGLNRYLLEPVE